MNKRKDFARKLEEVSSKYAEKTTRLSRLISRIESILLNLPGKTEVDVGDNCEMLKFYRGQRGWTLEYWCTDEDANDHNWIATESPVWVKVKVAKLLPEIIEKLTSYQAKQLESVEEGLKAIESIPWIDADAELAKAIEEESKSDWPPSEDEVPF